MEGIDLLKSIKDIRVYYAAEGTSSGIRWYKNNRGI
jgi:hypothetical protein